MPPKLGSESTAVDTYLTTEGYNVSIKSIEEIGTFYKHLLQEDDTGYFDSCESGSPEENAPNSGYRQRKLQFAKEIPIKDGQGKITSWKWVFSDDGIYFCGSINLGTFKYYVIKISTVYHPPTHSL